MELPEFVSYLMFQQYSASVFSACFSDAGECKDIDRTSSVTTTDNDAKTERHNSSITRYYLDAFSQSLCKSLSVDIALEHQFLDIKEEAYLEKFALFSNVNNVQCIDLLLSHFGLGEGNVVVVSVDQCTSNVYHRGGVLGSFYVGISALTENPRLIVQMIRQIFSQMRSQGLTTPIVFCNAVGLCINQSVNLLQETSESLENIVRKEALDAAVTSSDPMLINQEEKIFSSIWLLLQLLMQEACREEIPILLKSSKKPRLDHAWICYKAKEIGSMYCQGIYVVDLLSDHFSIYYSQPNNQELLLLTTQEHQIDGKIHISLKQCIESEKDSAANEAFSDVIDSIKKNVVMHALANSIRPIVCKILQTGLTRQQHFIGHMRPLHDMIF